ncbi:YadA-like C-terminal domain protein 2 [Elysia marginata]|uniref:YadA-like C-terminal domain protein 2 n=1 Tax=Elysia marginata TaxID=1093978 RepID=A0AAV4G6R4_9GAST|nr:YadA-like C-terminal domain protein 2 [Elysia marginata]
MVQQTAGEAIRHGFMLVVTICIVCWSSSQAAVLPGVRCYPRCGLNALCNPDGSCSCPSNLPLGDPGLVCYNNFRSACFAFGDPKITGFNNEKSRIMFPYAVLSIADTVLSIADVVLSIADAVLSIADAVLSIADTVMSIADTVLSIADVVLTIADAVLSIADAVLTIADTVHLEAGTVNYYKNGGSLQTLTTRDCETVQVDSRPVSICHAESKGIWRVAAPDCGDTEVVFRPWNVERENQVEVVGFGILTQQDSDFSDLESGYPFSMCHVPPPYGSSNWYHDFYQMMDLQTRYGSFLYSFLLHPPYELQPDPLCQDLTTIFTDCPRHLHVKSVNVCSPILIKYGMCAKRNAESPLVAFINCMKGVCSVGSEHGLCQVAHRMISGQACPDTPELECD